MKQPPLRSWPLSSDTGLRQKALLGYAPLEHLLPAQCFKRTALVTISSSPAGDTGRRPVASRLTFTFLRRIATSECACPCTVHSNPCASRPSGRLVRLMRIHHSELPHSPRNMSQQHKPPTNPHLQNQRDHIEDFPILRKSTPPPNPSRTSDAHDHGCPAPESS